MKIYIQVSHQIKFHFPFDWGMSPDLFFLSIISLEQEGSNEETDDLSIQTQVRKAVNSFDFIT